MSNYRMNNRSMNTRSVPYRNQTNCTAEPCTKVMTTQKIHWGDLPVAMAYVPMQKYGKVFEPSKALQMGTIFPELCKPFCGKGGGC